MTRTCPYCKAVVEDSNRPGDPCTICFGPTDGTIRGLAFGGLFTLIVVVGALIAWWLAP